MNIRSIMMKTKLGNDEEINVIYNLYFRNAFYSLECFKEGKDKEKSLNYCYVEDLTEDEGDAEMFLNLVSKGKVLPVHIKDIAVDCLNTLF